MRGGKRVGAGRKPGSKSRRTKEREAVYLVTAKKLKEALGDKCFDGNAHDLMVSVYKDQTLDLAIRLDAAKSAAPYELPKLQAIEHSGNVGTKTHEDWLDELEKAEHANATRKPTKPAATVRH